MIINIFNTEDELIHAMALYFIKIANHSIEKKNLFDVVLSGGKSPEKHYELLATDEFKNQIDWSKVNFFFGDERYVPVDDPQRNSWMIQKSLFDPLNISSSQIFEIDTTLPPVEAANKYNEKIAMHFKGNPVQFDLTLLGLGNNAHTASLFPFTSVLKEMSATIKAVILKEQDVYRITMTAPMINQSRHIAFLVYGKDKAESVKHVLNDEPDFDKYPAQLIKPDGELQWFLDADAASLLKK